MAVKQSKWVFSLMTQLETVLLSNDNGMSVEIINFGGRIKSIKFPINSKPTEMTLGYSSAEEYLNDEFYMGATCGRVCNRIADGKFELDGRQYQLPLNEGENCLHGGDNSFSGRYWKIDRQALSHCSVTLLLVSDDGDQGFPGTLNLSVTYLLSADNKLSIKYSANSDLATPVNLTNHSYFNLGEKDCLSLHLKLNSSGFLETDAAKIPTGNIVAVSGSNYDFTKSVSIGYREEFEQEKFLKKNNGYDDCFSLNKSPFEQPKAVLISFSNRVSMSVYTDQTAIQLYTGFNLNGKFKSYQGVCLEAQNYTDAENNKHFSSNVLKPNQQYQRRIIFKFESIN